MPARLTTYTLSVPDWTPPLLNSVRGRHWSVEHRAKRKATELLTAYARQQGIPPATGRRRLALVVTLGPGQRPPDADAYDKLLLDSLTRAGLLLDDGPRGLVRRLAVTVQRGPRPETVLTLTEAGPTLASGPRRSPAGRSCTGNGFRAGGP